MASVKEIAADIKSTYGSGFINATQAGKYLGMSRDKYLTFLSAIPVYRTGREKKYHALDIAKHMAGLHAYEPYGAG